MKYSFYLFFLVLVQAGLSCGKGSSDAPPPPANPCAGTTVSVAGTVTNPSTIGGNDGSISVSATGGAGFSFSINGGSFLSSGIFAGLVAGNYTITAKNSTGCTGAASFTVSNPSNLCNGVIISVNGTFTNPTTVGGSNGTITASATGSTGFTFSLNNGAFQASGNFIGLVAGNYSVTAKDLNGCTGAANFVLTDPNLCAGITITVTNTITGNTPCEANTGQITAAATGGTGSYTFSINNGSFQASNTFGPLASANYIITAKDGNGCTGSSNAIVSNVAAGPLFTAVKNLVQANCVSCHNTAVTNGGMDFSVDCNIVLNKDRVKARAVDGNPSPMPQGGLLPVSEQQKITNWINAGGKYSN
jgi:SprB repeat